MAKPFKYYTSCVNCGGPTAGNDINDMTSASREITLKTMRKHCDMLELEQAFGYGTGGDRKELRLCNDWHVGYYKSVFRGKPCYYLKHSGIEYIFVEQDKPRQVRLSY